jgi:hypothetical protein
MHQMAIASYLAKQIVMAITPRPGKITDPAISPAQKKLGSNPAQPWLFVLGRAKLPFAFGTPQNKKGYNMGRNGVAFHMMSEQNISSNVSTFFLSSTIFIFAEANQSLVFSQANDSKRS